MATKAKKKQQTGAFTRRDNFSQAVLKILYRRAGGKCCKCGAPTFGPVSNNPYKSVNIGKGAHIAAAAPGGPRYDPKMNPEVRSSATNGLWLCSNCHDLIDRDEEAYPTKKLQAIKKEAEERVRKELGVATIRDKPDTGPSDVLAAGVSAAAIVEIRKSKSEILQLNGVTVNRSEGEKYLEAISFINLEEDSYLPSVGNELQSHFTVLVAYCRDPSVVSEVIRRLKSIADSFHSQWTREDVETISKLIRDIIENTKSKRSRVYQSSIALLKELASYKALKEKGWNVVPGDMLKDLRYKLRPRDETDADAEPSAKRQLLDTEEQSEEERYLSLMEALSECSDEQEMFRLEGELEKLGYDPNIA